MTKFHILDILSITHDRLISLDHMDGIYKILNYLTGENLFTHQLVRVSKTCKPYLLKTYPTLSDSRIEIAFEKLTKVLDHLRQQNSPDDDIMLAIKGWAVQYVYPVTGEYLDILPLDAPYQHMNPVDELVWMKGDDDGIIAVNVEG